MHKNKLKRKPKILRQVKIGDVRKRTKFDHYAYVYAFAYASSLNEPSSLLHKRSLAMHIFLCLNAEVVTMPKVKI